MLVEKEVIRPGTYWYRDEASGQPRKLVVTPELTRYWHEQGNAMLSAGLTVPVPCEHDFDAHPMTPAEKLKSNAGWIKGYSLKGDALFSSVDIQDESIAKKLPSTIRWTSPWINSFTDGNGREWKNVISHLALTTRPRIIEQQPFGSVAAALSMASEAKLSAVSSSASGVSAGGFCLSRAGLLDPQGQPQYPMAFSLWNGGIPFETKGAAMDLNGGPPKKDKPKPGTKPAPVDAPEDFGTKQDGEATETEGDASPTDNPEKTGATEMDPLADAGGDIAMEEILCHLLQALGVPMPDGSNEAEFKRHLYEATMSKIKELTSKGMGNQEKEQKEQEIKPDQNKPPQQQPNASHPSKAPNPLIQQESQPMFMSLEEINALPDPMRGVALSMYNENQKLRAQVEANQKVTDGLRAAKLKEAEAQRTTRIALLTKLSPRAKGDLDAMLAQPAMALSMDDKGTIIDPMAATLAVLEKGLADLPWLATNDAALATAHPHPQDADMLSPERANELADGFARQMGCTVG